MQKIEFNLEGIFWEKIIPVKIFLSKNNKNLIFNIHGVYSSADDATHNRFAKHIAEWWIANIILFGTSRKNIPYDNNLTPKENGINNFVGKTFENELADARIVFSHILENCEKFFKIPKEELNIIVNGNSLGGTLAFYLAAEFPEIHQISTVGTGLRKAQWNFPIIDTFPELNEYKKILKNFRGKYLMHESGDDNKFSPEQFDEFFETIGATEKHRIYYPWVNHPFTRIQGENSEIPYNQVRDNIIHFFLEK